MTVTLAVQRQNATIYCKMHVCDSAVDMAWPERLPAVNKHCGSGSVSTYVGAACALQVTASGDKSLVMWDMATYKSTAAMFFHTSSVKSVDVSTAAPSERGGKGCLWCVVQCHWYV